MTTRKEKNQGMNWISQHKRLAIYMRDGLACCYCGASCEEAKLTLDHIKPYSKGGSNHETNLVTCCHRCNSSRGNRTYTKFAADVAKYLNHGVVAKEIISHIKNTSRRVLDLNTAKQLVVRRGSCFNALKFIK